MRQFFFWKSGVFWCYLQTSFAFGRQPLIDLGRVLFVYTSLYSSLYCTVLWWMKLYGEKLPIRMVNAALCKIYIEEVPWFFASNDDIRGGWSLLEEESGTHFPTGLNQFRKIVHRSVIHFYKPETPWNKTSMAVQSDKSVFLRFGPCGF